MTERRAIFAAAAGATFVLFGVALLGKHGLPTGHTGSDENAYLTYARNLLHGRYAIASAQANGDYLWHGPGLPIVLTPFVAVGIPVQVTRLLGPLFLLGAGWLLFIMLRPYFGWRRALCAGLALALFPPFWRTIVQLFTEPLALFCALAALWAGCRAARTGRSRWFVLSGVTLGFTALTRPEYGYVLLAGFLLGALCLTLPRTRRFGAGWITIFALALIVCAPWLAYTYSLTHKPLYWASSGGDSLYWMASDNPGETGSWQSSADVATNPHLASHRTLEAQWERLPQVQRAAREEHVAIKLIRAHPVRYATHLADNLGRMVVDEPYSYQAISAARVAFYGIPTLGLLLLAGIGAWRWRAGRRRVPLEIKLLWAAAAVAIVLHLPASADPRMMMLAIPGLAATAFAGLPAIRNRRPWERRPAPRGAL